MPKRKFDERKVNRDESGRFASSGTPNRFGSGRSGNVRMQSNPPRIVQKKGESDAAFKKRVKKRTGGYGLR